MYKGREQTLSEEAKTAVRLFMEEGKEYSRGELVAAIKNGTERREQMTDGVVAGAIKMLSTSGELVPVARGRYRLGHPQAERDLKGRVIGLFDRFRSDLDRACRVNVLSLSEQDFSFVRKVTEMTGRLETEIEELEKIGGTQDLPDIQHENPPVTEPPEEGTGSNGPAPLGSRGTEPDAEPEPDEAVRTADGQSAPGTGTGPQKTRRKEKKKQGDEPEEQDG